MSNWLFCFHCSRVARVSLTRSMTWKGRLTRRGQVAVVVVLAGPDEFGAGDFDFGYKVPPASQSGFKSRF